MSRPTRSFSKEKREEKDGKGKEKIETNTKIIEFSFLARSLRHAYDHTLISFKNI